jgi:hypothetical protein
MSVKEALSRPIQTDFMRNNPAYSTWIGMHARCKFPSHTSWANYGGRGISVCPEWDTFEQFWADMGGTYWPGLSIERKDNGKGYSPENCTWIPNEDQHLNRRTNTYIDTPWGRMTVTAAAKRIGIGPETLRFRLKRGLIATEALTRPVQPAGRKSPL